MGDGTAPNVSCPRYCGAKLSVLAKVTGCTFEKDGRYCTSITGTNPGCYVPVDVFNTQGEHTTCPGSIDNSEGIFRRCPSKPVTFTFWEKNPTGIRRRLSRAALD